MQLPPMPPRECACGCGQSFQPHRATHKYYNDAHKQKAKRDRAARVEYAKRINAIYEGLIEIYKTRWSYAGVDREPSLQNAVADAYEKFNLSGVAELLNALCRVKNAGFDFGYEKRGQDDRDGVQ